MQIPFTVKDTATHVIALRYSFRSSLIYYATTDQEAFKVWLEPAYQSMLNQPVNTAWNAGVGGMPTGLFGMLSLLHFLFFAPIPTNAYT